MIDTDLIIRDVKRCGFNIQKIINSRYKDDLTRIIDNRFFDPEFIGSIVTREGFRFGANPNIRTLFEVADSYRVDDIRDTDIVLDIGANVGGFAIPAAAKAQMVFAVEPILTDELRRNIEMNPNHYIAVIPAALGDGTHREVSWCGETRYIKTTTLTQLIKMCGGHIDFLKCDCEGGEWFIRPEELVGIRRIEMELHYFRGMKPDTELIDFIQNNYDTVIDYRDPDTRLLHAECKP